jgi:hypothetical protein
MRIKNALDLPTALASGKGSDGRPFLALVIKGTFQLANDGRPATLSREQRPVLGADVPVDPEAPGGLLRFESDRVPFKPRSDVVLVGSARAPGGRAVAALDVRIRVGPLDRFLRVFGDRRWVFPTADTPEPIVSRPEPFAEMPLTWDRAFGGVDEAARDDATRQGLSPWDPRNWFGRGYLAARTVASIHGRPLANLEDPASPVTRWDSRPAPVGCGFFPRNSEPRVRWLGTHDEAWKARRAPELPEDFRFDAFNGADPAMQVEGYLAGNEPVTLQHVDARRPTLSFYLPGLAPVVTVTTDPPPGEPPGAPPRRGRVAAPLDTLVFVPDEGVFYQVWRAFVPLRDAGAAEVRELRIDYETRAPAATPPARGVAGGRSS